MCLNPISVSGYSDMLDFHCVLVYSCIPADAFRDLVRPICRCLFMPLHLGRFSVLGV